MLKERLSNDLKAAMRDRDQRRVATLRLILAALKEQEINQRGDGGGEDGLDDDAVMQTLSKMVRQRRDSIRMYEEAGRVDLAEQENAEIGIIEGYLPQQLTPEEIEEVASQVKDELGAKGLKDMGRCMSVIKDRYAGRLDMGRASQKMKQLLS